MRHFYKLFILLVLQLLSSTVQAELVDVNSLHYWSSAKQNRLMIDLSASPAYQVALLDRPARLVIDVRNAHLGQALAQPPASHPLFAKIRVAQKKYGVRIVADLKRRISFNSFKLNPNSMYGHRLVVDVADKGPINSRIAKDNPVIHSAKAKTTAQSSSKASRRSVEDGNMVSSSTEIMPTGRSGKNIVVAIDAGHGGDDPGAHGPGGTEEKQVVFAIAKKLAELIGNQKGMKAVMVRKGDYYVNLRKRMEIARAANADLFVSIHADAFQKSSVKGASVFTLSRRGASSEAARWLADSENASDLVGGVRLDDKEEVLASVLMDLSQTATQEASYNAARHVLKNFENISELHFDQVQKAGFLVLKSPDIPSILVETAFISNPSEERKLRTKAYQSKIALAIFKGVRDYFKQYLPVDTRVAGL